MPRFSHRVALITGASSGIGRATALRLAQEGAAVALVALPGDDLEAAAEECRATGSDALAVPADVADSDQVAAAFDHAESLGPVAAAPAPARERAENESTIPVGRFGQPGDIAAAVTFLLSDEAGYITGANMVVDGGRTSCFTAGTLGMPD